MRNLLCSGFASICSRYVILYKRMRRFHDRKVLRSPCGVILCLIALKFGNRLDPPAEFLVMLQFFCWGAQFLLALSKSLAIPPKWSFCPWQSLCSNKNVSGSRRMQKKLDTDKELINQGDGALVSRGTLPNLEKRVEISASTELWKGMCFLLSLGASPIPTFSIFTKSLI